MSANERPRSPTDRLWAMLDLDTWLERYVRLARATAPVLSPAGLALALALAASLALAWLMQFGAGTFDHHPGWAIASSLVNTALATGLAVLVVRPARPIVREQVFVWAACGAVALVSLGALDARVRYRAGLGGTPLYAPPHYALPYAKTAERVTLHTSDNVSLAATLLATRHPRSVLVVPTWRTNRDAFAITTLAQWLAQDFDVLVIDPRGQGESGGAKSPGGQDQFDVLAAVAYLRATGHDRVGVLAEADAGYPAMLAAASHPGIDSLAVVAPTDDWGASLGQTHQAWDPRSLAGRLYWRVAAGLSLAGGPDGPRAIETVRRVAPTPLLFLGTHTGPGSTIDRLHLAADEPKSLLVLGGDAQPVGWDRYAAYYQAVQAWFKLSLNNPQAPPGRP